MIGNIALNDAEDVSTSASLFTETTEIGISELSAFGISVLVIFYTKTIIKEMRRSLHRLLFL